MLVGFFRRWAGFRYIGPLCPGIVLNRLRFHELARRRVFCRTGLWLFGDLVGLFRCGCLFSGLVGLALRLLAVLLVEIGANQRCSFGDIATGSQWVGRWIAH